MQEIQSGAQTTREPVYSMRANSYGVNDLGNTYRSGPYRTVYVVLSGWKCDL